MKQADVVIIGAGLAGIFAAWELSEKRPDLKVVVIEEGRDIQHRACPIVSGQTDHCIHCPICAIMRGYGGAGAFSDGKFNFTTEFGGWLTDYLPDEEVLSLIEEVDQINCRFGATQEVHSTYSPEAEQIRKRALSHDIHLLNARCKHLGTDRNREVLIRQYNELKTRVEFQFETRVQSIIPICKGKPLPKPLIHPSQPTGHNQEQRLESDAQQEQLPTSVRLSSHDNSSFQQPDGYCIETSRETLTCRKVIAAPGRAGADWFATECRQMGLRVTNNQVDLGVRVEVPALVFKEITDVMYEAKLKYRTKQYGDIVRTFCMNPYGYVVSENTDGIITVNGHSFEDPAKRSENTNFALLVSNRFTEPFNEPNRYGQHIASLSNMLGGGVMVQRLGDLIEGRRTTEHRLKKSFVHPTLNATAGDLSLVLPKRHLDNIVEMLEALDRLAPGTANKDTLLYGVEVKFYSSRLMLDSNLETELQGLYAVGDGAGITRGLSQAGASGLKVARSVLKSLEEA